MKPWSFVLGLVLILASSITTDAGKCTGDQITKMLDKGFSTKEIQDLCAETAANELSINLDGQWRFVSESPYGNVDEYWKLKWNKGTLSIDARRASNFQYRWVPLKVLSQEISGNNLHFRIKDSVYSTTVYALTIRGDDRIEGSYAATDTFIKDMGGGSVDAFLSVPTDFGSAQNYSGPARLIRE